jgi:diadenosine tetraphosphate (Ap4A) HIT family hydrolase
MRTLRPEEIDAILRLEPQGCPICAFVERRSPAIEIARTEHAVCVVDRFGVRRGHLLIGLARHAERIAELSWTEWSSLQRMAWVAARAIESALHPVRVYVAALGSAVPLLRSCPHVHLHVIPLYDGGEADRPSQIMTWKNGVIVYDPGEDRALADELTAAWPAAERENG